MVCLIRPDSCFRPVLTCFKDGPLKQGESKSAYCDFVPSILTRLRLFWLMPDVGIAIFAVGVDIGFQCTTAYLIDCYTRYAASAIAAAVLLRSFCGFGFPLFADSIYDKLGCVYCQ